MRQRSYHQGTGVRERVDSDRDDGAVTADAHAKIMLRSVKKL